MEIYPVIEPLLKIFGSREKIDNMNYSHHKIDFGPEGNKNLENYLLELENIRKSKMEGKKSIASELKNYFRS